MGRTRESAFESIARGLEEAIAWQRGELVEGVRTHRFERLPDGSVRRLDAPLSDHAQSAPDHAPERPEANPEGSRRV